MVACGSYNTKRPIRITDTVLKAAANHCFNTLPSSCKTQKQQSWGCDPSYLGRAANKYYEKKLNK